MVTDSQFSNRIGEIQIKWLLGSLNKIANAIIPNYLSTHTELTDLYELLAFVSVIEYVEDIKYLLQKRKLPIPLIIRSIFEIYVAILWTNLDESNIKEITYRSCKEELKSLQSYHPYLDEQEGYSKYKEERIMLLKKRIDELKSGGVKLVDIKTKCEKLGLQFEYDIMYSLLSTEAHATLSALEERHLLKKKKGSIRLVYDHQRKIANYKIELLILFKCYTEIIRTFIKQCDTKFDKSITRIDVILDRALGILT